MSRRMPAALAAWVLATAALGAAVDASAPPDPRVFPPRATTRQVVGELVAADFLHRAGRLRLHASSQLVDFTLLPAATIHHLGAEADLRDVPLGTSFRFHVDGEGATARVAAMVDDVSQMVREGTCYRLVGVRPGALDVVMEPKPAQGSRDIALRVDERTRVWKGDRQATLQELAVGDLLLAAAAPGRMPQLPDLVRDLWVGTDTHQRIREAQRQKHRAFLKDRGVPALVDRVEGKRVTVTLFGDPAGMQALFKDEGIHPEQWAKERSASLALVAASDELRTYNPVNDRQYSQLVAVERVPTDGHGCSGERWTFEPNLLLEGFRPGRFVRVFVHGGWPMKDMPYGEGLYEFGIETNDWDPFEYPFRTDFANAHLPWYRLAPGVFPPHGSEHVVHGDLLSVDAAGRRGRFRAEHDGAEVDFTLPPHAAVLHLGAEADPGDLPPGTRCRFALHQDAAGAFTQVSEIADDYSCFTTGNFTWRLDAVTPVGSDGAAELLVARRTGIIVDYNGDSVRPPDLGCCTLAIDGRTRLWKGGQRVALKDLAAGDELLVNRTGRSPTSEGRCTDVWIGADTARQVTEAQRLKHRALARARGMPAYIQAIDGRMVTITFHAACRADFPALLDGEAWGKPIWAQLLDGLLRPAGDLVKMGMANRLPEGATAGTHGCSGVRWVLDVQPPPGWVVGATIRVFKEGWPLPEATPGAAAPR